MKNNPCYFPLENFPCDCTTVGVKSNWEWCNKDSAWKCRQCHVAVNIVSKRMMDALAEIERLQSELRELEKTLEQHHD